MKTAELHIYDDIGEAFGGLTPTDVADTLRALPPHDRLRVRINSAGGSVFDGMAIYNLLRRHRAPVTVDVDGAACSIAAVIAQAAGPGNLNMAKGSFLMVHSPWHRVTGEAGDLRKAADLLDKLEGSIVNVLADRSQAHPDDVRNMLRAETWLSAEEAVRARLADRITNAPAVAALWRERPWIRDTPEPVRARAEAAAAAKARLDEAIRRRA